MALVFRPDKDHKWRGAWNMYHHWVGRAATALAIAEIFIGLKYSSQAPVYSIGAAIVIGALFLFGAGKEVFDKCLRAPPVQSKGDLALAELGESRGKMEYFPHNHPSAPELEAESPPKAGNSALPAETRLQEAYRSPR